MIDQNIVIDSRLVCVSAACTWLTRLFALPDLSETARYQVETCMVEGINNAILHAYGGEGGHDISISYKLADDFLQLKICDSGRAMHKEQTVGLPASESETGRGWFIIQSWMDSVDYHSDSAGNILIMKRHLRKMRSKKRIQTT
ncbi:MAG: ATP-binding protein [Gammaproteobacteria bacterium]|nr:ATP-binding protein [Gammaproteobacteria bacterium]